jgi:hypothetical protein
MHVVECHTFVAVLGFRSVGSLIKLPVSSLNLEAGAVVDSTGSEGKCDVDVRCLDKVCGILSVSDEILDGTIVCLPATFMGISSTWVL